jgi:integrase
MAKRRGQGEGSVFKDARGLWTAKIELPPLDGKRRRKVIRRKDKGELLAELRKMQAELGQRGDLPTAGKTVDDWFTYWLDNIAAKEVTPGTLAGYRGVVKNHIVPGLGPTTKVDRVSAPIVRRLHDRMTAAGLSSTYALNAHNIGSGAMKAAVREGIIGTNPFNMVSPPRKAVAELDVLDLDEAVHLLEVLAARPDGAQRATSLLAGARRGEVIGLEADRVDDVLDLSWQLRRLPWSHGCSGRCGYKRGGDCPDRKINARPDYEYRQIKGGLFWTRPKSRKGWRIIPLVDPLRPILERHIATMEPNAHGLLFTRPNGDPIDPDDDSAAWRDLMKATFGEDRNVRLHDLRHAAADLMYLAGVDEDIIQEILGHTVRATTRAYKKRGNTTRLVAAMEKMGALVSSPTGTPGTGA